MPEIKLNDTDQKILDELSVNGRESVARIAHKLEISDSLVRRRIASLVEEGVIAKFTVAINHHMIGRRVEAYILVDISIDSEPGEVLEEALSIDDSVREVSTLAGDPDALIRVRVDDPLKLRKLVMKIRQIDGITGTKTVVALDRRRFADREIEPTDEPE